MQMLHLYTRKAIQQIKQISVLRLLSKVFERVIYNQLGKYMDTFLNKLLCGFRKAHSTQHSIIPQYSLYSTFHSTQHSLFPSLIFCVFAVEENGRVFGRSKVDVIQGNFLNFCST